jgi:hypothetical protein
VAQVLIIMCGAGCLRSGAEGAFPIVSRRCWSIPSRVRTSEPCGNHRRHGRRHWNHADLPKALGCSDWYTARVTTLGEFDEATNAAHASKTGAYIQIVGGKMHMPPALAYAHEPNVLLLTCATGKSRSAIEPAAFVKRLRCRRCRSQSVLAAGKAPPEKAAN